MLKKVGAAFAGFGVSGIAAGSVPLAQKRVPVGWWLDSCDFRLCAGGVRGCIVVGAAGSAFAVAHTDGKLLFLRQRRSNIAVEHLYAEESRIGRTRRHVDREAIQPARRQQPVSAACVDASIESRAFGDAGNAYKGLLIRLLRFDLYRKWRRLTRHHEDIGGGKHGGRVRDRCRRGSF